MSRICLSFTAFLGVICFLVPSFANGQVSKPTWLPLAPKQAEYTNKLLNYWQSNSEQIDRYRVRFKRWQYDTVFGPRDLPYSFSEGRIEYAHTDKGQFKTERLLYYTRPADTGAKPKYKARPNERGDHWIWDGDLLFEFDYKGKKLFEYEFTSGDRDGATVTKIGPFVLVHPNSYWEELKPFLLGNQVAQIKTDYWLRVLTPESAEGQVWLEAVPKKPQAAAIYKRIELIISTKDFLPQAIRIFPSRYDSDVDTSHTIIQLENREINFSDPPDERASYRPATPEGWTRIVQRLPVEPTAQVEQTPAEPSKPQSGGRRGKCTRRRLCTPRWLRRR